MSRKMLKRSLALGALMAFVITGQAWAAELTINSENGNYSVVGTEIGGELSEVYSSLQEADIAGEMSPYETKKNSDKTNVEPGKGLIGGTWTGTTVKAIGMFVDKYNGNKVSLNGGVYNGPYRIYGASNYAEEQEKSTSNANGNVVDVKNVTMAKTGSQYPGVTGGWSWNDANGNNITIEDSTLTDTLVYGGDAQFGDANNNTITIKNSTVGYINGGTTRYDGYDAIGNGKGNANNNKVFVYDSTVVKSFKGGSAGGYGNANGNYIEVTNLEFTGDAIDGGFAECGNVEKNKIIINGDETKITGLVYGGRSQDKGNAVGNEVVINAGTFTNTSYGIVGGITENENTFDQGYEGDALENTVTINGGDIKTKVYGGYSKKGATNENTVNITGGTFTDATKNIYGGYAAVEAIGNSVNVKGDVETINVAGAIRGGVAQTIDDTTANAESNKVYIENAIVGKSVYGGVVEKDNDEDGHALYNEIKIVNSTVKGEVHGGSISHADGEASSNKVTIENSKLEKWVSAGHSSYNDAHKNELVISGVETEIDSHVYGGRAQGNGSANYNKVTINDGVINGPVYGGAANDQPPYSYGFPFVEEATANNNEVTINGGTFAKDIYGGYTTTISSRTGDDYVANENIVTISGGTFNANIYGGHGVTEANNNTVNILGEANIINSNIYGGYVMNSNGVCTGNTLNIGDGWSDKIQSVQNFNTVNFGKDSSVTTNVTLGTGATINLANGDDYTGESYAINGKLTTLENDNATLTIGNIKANTYNIASEYAGTKNWVLENDLMQVQKDENGSEIGWNFDGQLQVTVEAKSASVIADNLGVSDSTGSLVAGIVSNASEAEKDSAGEAAADFINNVMNNAPDKGAAINAATKMGEAGGNSATAASIVKNVTGVTNDRLSFNCGHSAPHKGGHGVGLFEEGSGADIWVEYVHGKDEVEDMPSTAGKTSYEGQYNGIVMGVDFKKVNKFQSGIAFNYGEGDTNSLGSSVRTHSDYDFWGVGYYGNIHNDDSNVIFDINYAKTDSDVTQYNSGSTLEASPETTTWSAGVKLEKLYQNENVQIVPYTGLRYMSIDADDYSTKKGEFYYSMDRQDIWLLPVGVSIRQEVANDNGWTVSPRVDLSYIWAFGDTNSNMEVKSPFPGVSQIGYDVMDDGSFLGLVGIEAHKGQWGYGVAYSYQKGDHSESKKWYVDVNYSF